MNEPLDELYFKWLCSHVESPRARNPQRTHRGLLRQLFTKEFVWIIPNDDNRVEDGRELRRYFLDAATFEEADPEWLGEGCSMLEMLVALSGHLSFEDGRKQDWWFWHMIDNAGLLHVNDNQYDETEKENIDEVLDAIIWRRYARSGEGGLFPLRHADEDQREVELWYQFNAYILEQD